MLQFKKRNFSVSQQHK